VVGDGSRERDKFPDWNTGNKFKRNAMTMTREEEPVRLAAESDGGTRRFQLGTHPEASVMRCGDNPDG